MQISFAPIESYKRRNDENIYDKDEELQGAQVKAVRIKKEIKRMQKALYAAYDVDGIVRLENQLKQLQTEADAFGKVGNFWILESEAVSLVKVKQANEKAMKELGPDVVLNKRFKKTKGSLADLKNEVKEKQELLRTQEKLVQEDHNTIVEMEEKCRKLAQLMREHNKTSENAPPEQNISEKEIQDLNDEIQKLEEEKASNEESFKKVLRKLKFDVKEAESHTTLLSVKLKEKEQESRLDDLRIRELKRSIPHKTLKPLYTTRSPTHAQATTHYSSHLKTSRKPFNKSSLSKVPSHTQLKPNKRKSLSPSYIYPYHLWVSYTQPST